MRAYREKDFDDMASRVVDRFMSGQSKLADAAVQEAMGGQLNPDQIERLVQAANTMAFLRMMEERQHSGAGDLMHEFDPVDTRGVIQSILGATPTMGHEEPPHEEPDGDEWELPDEMSARRGPHAGPPGAGGPAAGGEGHGGPGGGEEPHEVAVPAIDQDNDGPFPKGSKQKEKDDADKKDKKAPAKAKDKDEAKEAAFHDRKLRKLAGLLDDQYLQAELAFDDGYARLQGHLKRAHGAPALEALEKDAAALDGGPYTATVLNLVRQDQGLEARAESYYATKHAELADRHVVTDYPALKELETLVKIAEQADKLRRGADLVRSRCA